MVIAAAQASRTITVFEISKEKLYIAKRFSKTNANLQNIIKKSPFDIPYCERLWAANDNNAPILCNSELCDNNK